MKKYLLLLFCLVSSLMASAESGTCGKNLTWELEDGILVISGTGSMTNYYSPSSRAPWYSSRSTISLAIISEGVTSIGDYAFYECSGLTSITLPNSVTSIGDHAFYKCSGLTSVTIPNSVTSIGDWAFDGCSSLTSINIPNSVTSIGHSAFYECIGLTSVTIPNSVTSIGDWAFDGCSSLTSINIPNSVTSIGSSAFSFCSGLNSINIPNSVTSIGDHAFSGCSGLTSINIPNSVTSIGNSAFYNCRGLTSVTIPNSVTSIGGSAFYNCSGLTSINIPNSVTSIGNSAFGGCSGLTSITIPNSVTSIGESAFISCNRLTSVKVLAATPPTCGANLLQYAGISTIHVYEGLADAYKAAAGWNSYNFVDDIPSVRVTNLTLDATIYQCGIGQRFTPQVVTYEPVDATIKEVTWSSSDPSTLAIVPSTGACIGLKNGIVTITATAKDSGHVTATATVYVGNATPATYTISAVSADETMGTVDGAGVYNKDAEVTLTATPAEGYKFLRWSDGSTDNPYTFVATENKELVANFVGTCGDNLTWTLEDGTLTISGTGAMTNYEVVLEPVPWNESRESITALVVEEGVTSIGNHAFNGLTSLQTAQLPNTLERIGQRAFNDNVSLESVTLPEALTRIEDWAFANCTSLSAFAIPANTTYVATTSIERCSSLQSISVAEENSQYISVDGVLYDRAMTMVHTYPAGKSGAYVIPDGVTSVARAAFNGCTQLSSIVIPEGVTSIGSWGFGSCSSLTSVELPESLERMEYQVFINCTSLVFIKSLSEMPATVGVNDWHENTFVGMPSRTILFVHSANIENYRNDEDWSQAFSSIIPFDATYDFANGQTYKMRLASNPDLYIAVDKVANSGTESGDSAVKFCSEEDASLLVFAQMGEAVTITDAVTGRGICNSRAVHWRFSNTDTDAWWVDYNSSDKTLYLITRYGYWKTDNEEIGCSLYTNGDKNLKLELVPCSVQNLDDGAPYVQERDMLLKEVTYTRTFNNTNWQALYVPFQMSYEDWADEFEVAKVNNFHQSDTDDDGVFDTLEMEIIKVKSGTLKQNHPYLIRAKVAGEKTITLENTTLYPAEENAVTCSSVETLYTFTGTYSGVSGTDMMSNGYYSMGGGLLHQASSSAHSLAPYRWYLKMESRDGQVIPAPSSIRIKVFGDEDDSVEGIATSTHMPLPTQTYDLQGRKLGSAVHGIYILNNKKVMR